MFNHYTEVSIPNTDPENAKFNHITLNRKFKYSMFMGDVSVMVLRSKFNHVPSGDTFYQTSVSFTLTVGKATLEGLWSKLSVSENGYSEEEIIEDVKQQITSLLLTGNVTS